MGGLPLWSVDVVDADPDGKKSNRTMSVKVAAKVQPVLPDPIAGLLITEWYQNPEAPDERFKINVYILDSALRADALRVSLFRQERDGAGWRDAGVNPATSREIENAILTRARQLRLNQLDN